MIAHHAVFLTLGKEYRNTTMPTSTLTSKGQITVPKTIREHLHVAEGDQVDFAITPNGDVVMHRITGSVSDLAGLLHHPNRKHVSLKEMDNAIVAAVLDKTRLRQ
jgi:antitoxin PrlF